MWEKEVHKNCPGSMAGAGSTQHWGSKALHSGPSSSHGSPETQGFIKVPGLWLITPSEKSLLHLELPWHRSQLSHCQQFQVLFKHLNHSMEIPSAMVLCKQHVLLGEYLRTLRKCITFFGRGDEQPSAQWDNVCEGTLQTVKCHINVCCLCQDYEKESKSALTLTVFRV